jgi:hypothetical protein
LDERDGTKGITWDKNMEDEFWEFMLGMLQFIPKKWRKQVFPQVMTIIAPQ